MSGSDVRFEFLFVNPIIKVVEDGSELFSAIRKRAQICVPFLPALIVRNRCEIIGESYSEFYILLQRGGRKCLDGFLAKLQFFEFCFLFSLRRIFLL